MGEDPAVICRGDMVKRLECYMRLSPQAASGGAKSSCERLYMIVSHISEIAKILSLAVRYTHVNIEYVNEAELEINRGRHDANFVRMPWRIKVALRCCP